MGFGFGFSLMSALVPLIFLAVLAVFVAVVVKGIGQWNRNNHSPRLSVPAQLVAKRTDISTTHHHMAGEHHHHHHTYTTCYLTFQVDSGDRMELPVSGQQYGLLMEGDRGQLTFQGTRFLDFQRD